MSADDLIAAATGYAKRHPILPVGADKVALLPLEQASQDPDTLLGWIVDLSPAGIAMRTDHLIVIDIGTDAEETFARLGDELGRLPETRAQQTPAGGRHLFFRKPTAAAIEPGTLAPGVTRLAGPSCYVVAAPSHNGAGPYQWLIPKGAAIPAALVEFPLELEGWLDRSDSSPGSTPRASELDAATDAPRQTVAETSPSPDRAGTLTSLTAPSADTDLVADVNLTDVGNGIRIAIRHGADLRYCFPWNRWLAWDGRRWSSEDDGETVRRAKENARWLAASALELQDGDKRKAALRWAIESEKDARIRAALAMAQSEPGIPVTPADLDKDPWLLNVGNGTIDLRTGTLTAHCRDDLITKLAPVSFDPAAKAPLWERVLLRALPDPGVREYVQLLTGYGLTGSTREQRISIWWGAGSNAKSTVINTILSLLGEDYGQEAAPSVFLERRGDVIPNDIARLRGARLVIAVETAQNRRLNEALVKAMTGGDRLVARFMRSEFFEFLPTFTPVLVTNHLPVTSDATQALWRRIDIVPFTETIGDAERDLDLSDKLRDELPGVLNWALAGCLAWQRHGLRRPDAIAEATAGYRTDMDALGRFIDDCCKLSAAATVSSTVLYNRYAYWADENGEEKLSSPHFGRRLTDLGLKSKRKTAGKRFWIGIEIVPNQESDAK